MFINVCDSRLNLILDYRARKASHPLFGCLLLSVGTEKVMANRAWKLRG